MEPCKYCGVLPAYGHCEWCKVDRAPTAKELAEAVLEEAAHTVGGEGPSATLEGMSEAFLASLRM